MANSKITLKLSTKISKLLIATTLIFTNIDAKEAITTSSTNNAVSGSKVDSTKISDFDVANIAKLLEHSKSSMQNLETFSDGLTSFDLVISQAEVIMAIQYNNSRNSSPMITRLYLPSKIMGMCKELFNFYEKNSKELEPYREKISDIIASLGMLWPNAPMNELLKKQNLMSWANKIFYKERVVTQDKDKLEKQTDQAQKTEAKQDAISTETKDASSRASNQNSNLVLYSIKQGVTRKRKAGLCSSCNSEVACSRKSVQIARPTDVSVTRKGSVKTQSKENLPWMTKQSQPVEKTAPERTDARQQRITARRKPQSEPKTAKTEPDPDSLQCVRESKPQENPKNEQSSSPTQISGSNVR